MKTKAIITIIIFIIFLPLIGFAQFDFDIGNLFNTYNLKPDSKGVITDFHLVWSADTYVPYDYQGRTLPSQGSKLTIEAVVNISEGRASDLKYNWFVDGIFQEDKSGYSKNVFPFLVLQHPGAYHVIRGQVFNEDRSVFEEKSIKIPIVEPELVINSSIISPGREFSFIAKPYFFNIKKLTDLEFEWRFAGQEPIISSAYDASVLDLTITEKQDKEILENDLWVSVKNKKEPRQKAFQTIKVTIY